MTELLQRAGIIVAGSVLLSLVANSVSPRGISLLAPPKKELKAGDYLPLEKAKEMWSGGGAVFLDAREPDDYAAGHIGNSINLPVMQFEKYYPEVAPLLNPDLPIVVYCDGEQCELSHRLADNLRQQSFTNLHILFNGWTVWKNAGLATETGGSK